MSWINDFPDSSGTNLIDLKTKIIKVISNISAYTTININLANLYYNIIGDSINLGNNSTEFDNNLKLVVKRNDIRLLNGLDVLYVNSSEFNLPIELIEGEVITIQQFLEGV